MAHITDGNHLYWICRMNIMSGWKWVVQEKKKYKNILKVLFKKYWSYMLKDLFGTIGKTVGVVTGIAVAPIAYALGVSNHLVEQAIRAGCKTEKEVKKWLEKNT